MYVDNVEAPTATTLEANDDAAALFHSRVAGMTMPVMVPGNGEVDGDSEVSGMLEKAGVTLGQALQSTPWASC